jgi:ABC-type Fe3+/spermidine/putrescine transport system ATPase subunit
VKAVNGAEADVVLPGGESIAVRHDGTAKVGDERRIALRPEDFELSVDQRPGMNGVRGTVTRVNYLGASINAGVRVGETSLVVNIPRGRGAAREGEQVFVCWLKSAGIMLSGAA